MNVLLTEVEVRVLGSLMEKDATTPDYYPLSLNALVNACNQKSNRDPFMTLTEDAVRQALASLKEKKLAGPVNSADSRVTKYEHRVQEVFNFSRGENAALCVLMLRGAQTPGELRGRTERIHAFEGCAFHGDAEDWEYRMGGGDTGQMCCASSGGDENFHTA